MRFLVGFACAFWKRECSIALISSSVGSVFFVSLTRFRLFLDCFVVSGCFFAFIFMFDSFVFVSSFRSIQPNWRTFTVLYFVAFFFCVRISPPLQRGPCKYCRYLYIMVLLDSFGCNSAWCASWKLFHHFTMVLECFSPWWTCAMDYACWFCNYNTIGNEIGIVSVYSFLYYAPLLLPYNCRGFILISLTTSKLWRLPQVFSNMGR